MAVRRKSLGKALRCARSSVSLPRRSAMSLFSSWAVFAACSCSLIVILAYSPLFSEASINWSMSPSSTAWVLLVSTPVRRSLIRDWSST